MNFFRDRELAHRFRTGNVSEKEQMLYLLSYIVFTGASASFNLMNQNAGSSLNNYLMAAFSIFSTLLIVLACYNTNKKGDNKAFVARYFSLGFPIAVQTFIISMALGFIYAPIFKLIGIEFQSATYALVTITILGSLYYFFRLNGSFKIAAGLKYTDMISPSANAVEVNPPDHSARNFYSSRRPTVIRQQETQGSGSLAQRILHNLLHGFRIALFLPCKKNAFDTSWHALWFIAAVSMIFRFSRDFFYAEAPREFYYGGFTQEFFIVAIVLLSGYLVSTLFRRVESTVALAVIMLNAMLPLSLVTTVLYKFDIDWLDTNTGSQAMWIAWSLWIYLIAFRVIILTFNSAPREHLFAAVILLAAFFIPDRYFYFDDFWYSNARVENETPLDKISHESLFAQQDNLLKAQLSEMPPSTPSKTDVYGIVLGSYGHQEVFRREVTFVEEALEKHYGMKKRLITLLNNEETVNDTPLAMVRNLEAALKGLADKMQNEDIVLLYLTSHGSAEDGLSVTLGNGIRFEKMTAQRIAAALDNSGIKNQVIFISSCFSGSMIDELKGDHTLIMTAAAKDRTSFGCSDELEMTYFADAYFKKSLPAESNLIKAFELAKEHIRKREEQEKITQHSNPQIFIGDKIVEALEAYKIGKTVEGH